MQFLQNSKILLENFNSDNNKLNRLPRRFSARMGCCRVAVRSRSTLFCHADPSTGSGILGCCRVAERSRSTLLCHADPSTRRLEATLPFQGSFSGSGTLGCCRVAKRSRSTLFCNADPSTCSGILFRLRDPFRALGS